MSTNSDVEKKLKKINEILKKTSEERKVEEKKRGRPPKEKKIVEKATEKDIKIIEKNLTQKPKDSFRSALYLAVFSFVCIIAIMQIPTPPAIKLIVALLGTLFFIPIGLFFGMMVGNPYIRCRILRRMRRGDYAIVNFIQKDGRHIDTKIKNLEEDVVIHGSRLWIIQRRKIYSVDADGSKVFQAKIDPEGVYTIADVPVVFLDVENMFPVTFHREEQENIDPQQAGATLLGWVNNQITKRGKSLRDVMFIVINIALSVMNLVILYQLYDKLVGW